MNPHSIFEPNTYSSTANNTIVTDLILEKVSSQCDKTVRGVKKTTAITQDTKGGYPQPREILFL